ncbi:GTPase Era [Atopobacter sp. AH10]|uniref:GTPase Era n=1 Tax=Atopobacter sp. AH10 TaxID=2315861 RepID=UPI000EF1F005|nr:GTPase Era [Atopobacter sp. AH10]RLK62497.1 GTPase Era [Atopobacter sp. AH10]
MGAFHSGFVSIVGRPNVGKSTLMNQFLGQKVAIMSDVAQTTRNKVHGVYTDKDHQVVFIDTPGIHKPKHQLGEFMVQSAYSSLNEVDLVCFLSIVTQKLGPGDQFILEKLKGLKTPVYLVVNKIDQVTPEELLDHVNSYKDLFPFKEIVPVSALNGNNVDHLLDLIKNEMPAGPQYYPKNQVTDHPEYFIVSEFIREKIIAHTREEVPHSVAVQVESMQKNEQGIVDVHATIYIERSSQKGIIIGKNGQMLKRIGTEAREDIERLLASRVFLNLWVKVKAKWRDSQSFLDEFGYAKGDYE